MLLASRQLAFAGKKDNNNKSRLLSTHLWSIVSGCVMKGRGGEIFIGALFFCEIQQVYKGKNIYLLAPTNILVLNLVLLNDIKDRF